MKGSAKIISLTSPHSLWSGILATICVSSGYLYRIQQREAIQICAIIGSDYPMFYVEGEDKIYLSNKYWNKIFDPATNTVTDWGVNFGDAVELEVNP